MNSTTALYALGTLCSAIALRAIFLQIRSLRWPTITGKLLHYDTKSTPPLLYEFTHKDERRQGHRAFLIDGQLNIEQEAQLIELNKTDEAEIQIHVDPKRPYRNCLYPQIAKRSFMGLVVGIALLIAGFLS